VGGEQGKDREQIHFFTADGPRVAKTNLAPVKGKSLWPRKKRF
jgi:hypothetical protein